MKQAAKIISSVLIIIRLYAILIFFPFYTRKSGQLYLKKNRVNDPVLEKSGQLFVKKNRVNDPILDKSGDTSSADLVSFHKNTFIPDIKQDIYYKKRVKKPKNKKK